MKKVNYLTFLIAPIIGAILVRVIFVNCFYISGKELSDLENRKTLLVKENIELKRQNSYYSSLNHIKNKALQDGLIVLSMEFLETPSLASR
ncbi:MAG: hypothetical protein ABIB98_01935 [bacterium]